MIRWGEEKDRWLRSTRGVSFDQIAEQILAGEYLDVLVHPSRLGQDIYVLRIEGHTWAVPFVSEKGFIFLKTAFPSRKLHRRSGGLHAQDQTRSG